jgi:hypothetical protein
MKKLIKGDRNDIKVIGLYPRDRNRYYTIQAYTGKLAVDEKTGAVNKHIQSKKTHTNGRTKAEAIANRFIASLQEAWDKEFGADSQTTHAPPPAFGFEDELRTALDKIRMEKGDGNTFLNYKYEADALLRHMEPKYRRLPPPVHTKSEFERIVRHRLQKLTKGTGAPRQCLYKMRFLCKRIRGLPQACLQAIRTPRSRRLRNEFSFVDLDIEIMGGHLPEASNTVRVLFYEGAGAAQHWRDSVFLKWRQVDDWRESVRSGHREKTGAAFLNYIWPELIQCLDERERHPGDTYVCADIVFGPRERRKNPDCNKRELSSQEEARRANSVRVRAAKVFDGFLISCGRKRPGISYKSFRHYNASLGRASVQPDAVLLDYLGMGSKETLDIYAHSSPAQIVALGGFLRHHYLAVMKGERPTFIGCLTEAVRVLQAFIEQGNRKVQTQIAELRNLLSAILARLNDTGSEHKVVQGPVPGHFHAVPPQQNQEAA